MNTYSMLQLLRDYLGEPTAEHWSDVNLVRRLNQAQRKVTTLVAQSPGQWLVKRGTVTPSASVVTLPSDCAKPLYMEEVATGRVVSWLPTVGYRRVSREAGTTLAIEEREAYPLMSTIEVNQDDYENQCYLWYEMRPPDLHTGLAGSGTGASALVFAADLNLVYVDDYYNDVTVEVIDASGGTVDIRSVITDYTASTHTAVITGTGAQNDSYGTISVLPEITHDLIVLEAAVASVLKPGTTADERLVGYLRGERDHMRKSIEEWLASRIPSASVGVLVGDPLL